MSNGTKKNGDARQRISDTGKDNQLASISYPQTYANCREIQTRYLRRRCGLDERRARLVAALHFGEGR